MELSQQNRRGYRFGVFEVDLSAGELRRNGLKLKLQEQPFQVLAMLLERAPELATRTELAGRLWNGDTFVDFDHSLSVSVNKIREALGDSADSSRFVETIPKRGYRFIAPLEPINELINQPISAPISHPSIHPSIHPTNGAPAVMPAANGNGRAEILLADSTGAVPLKGTIPTVAVERTISMGKNAGWIAFSIILVAVSIVAGIMFRRGIPSRDQLTYSQLTNFSDAAVAPAISPDGRMLAFIRGDASFPSLGQVYVKLLPNGEPVQLTDDLRPKFGIAFSPDGTQIAYTVTNPERFGWDTVTVSALGGEPRNYVLNAAALSWLDDNQILFSRVESGVHMGIVAASDRGSELREIYLPNHEREMARFSYASPDRKWILVAESDRTGKWLPCRVVPLNGSSKGRVVGPQGECSNAGWSPDGDTMYFSAMVDGASHLWRQRFLQGAPEQLTFGPAEEAGLAIAPDGRSLISSVGINESAIWVHNSRGDHLVSKEGYAGYPVLSADSKRVYYQLRRQVANSDNELWMTDLDSGKSSPVVQGFSLDNRYDVSRDGMEVVFAAKAPEGILQVWLAPVDSSAPPVQITSSGGDHPFFGPDDEIIFRRSEGNSNFMYRMKRKGSEAIRIVPYSILNIKAVSPDRRWVIILAPVEGTPSTAVIAVPVKGGEDRRICPGQCAAKWTADGKQLYIRPLVEKSDAGKAIVFTLSRGEMLPPLPPLGLVASADALKIEGSTMVEMTNFPFQDQLQHSLGPDAAMFAYTKTTGHRNLFRIPLQ